MKPSNVIQTVISSIRARRPIFLEGVPGCGKSSIMRQVADMLSEQDGEKWDLYDFRACLREPVDVLGMPKDNGKGKMIHLIPDFLPTKGKGIFFADELDRASGAMQNALLQAFLEPFGIGDYRFPPGWVPIAAGNGNYDRGTSNMFGAMNNRFVHLTMDVDVDDWTQWACKADIHPIVIGFIRLKNEFLFQYDSKARPKAFPSPRSWEFTSQMLKQGIDPAIELELIGGIIGEGVANEFVGFISVFRDLPKFEEIVMNPKSAPVPKEPSGRYAVSGLIARKMTDQNIGNLIVYLERMEPEFSVMAVKDATARDRALCDTKAFTQWASKNKDALM